MPTTASATPRPGPRPSTSRREIVQCAIRMLDRDGAEALTFRAVARELDVAVGALGRYFRNLADLEDEVAAALLSGMRPLDDSSAAGLREQLLRFGLDWLEIMRKHPYLATILGPASAEVVARHVAQCVKVMVAAGIEFEQAMAIYSVVANLAYAWGVQGARQSKPGLQPVLAQVFSEQLGGLAPQIAKLAAAPGTAIYRRWLKLCIDGLLPLQQAPRKRR
ncbi:TetR/AcrR family transcriptional regulator [Solimonas terrae]|uniref:TetR/AcrR family transcriptional regulator n=1 Tax=Solimonas terrae TaxID=1396819 RepID=A0A6M2BNR5_9GAMM|nr:TetR family transcriptional regulator [Solimonas terrae]NGY04118.1 TetR/AcrR family transcriptional regulator [Solimonas terrae]